MTILALAGFVTLVLTLAWLSRRSSQRSTGCCAPADHRDDLRMRPAFDDDPSGSAGDSKR